jgi:hypothetical protein
MNYKLLLFIAIIIIAAGVFWLTSKQSAVPGTVNFNAVDYTFIKKKALSDKIETHHYRGADGTKLQIKLPNPETFHSAQLIYGFSIKVFLSRGFTVDSDNSDYFVAAKGGIRVLGAINTVNSKECFVMLVSEGNASGLDEEISQNIDVLRELSTLSFF